jgi:hypothetical protein
MNNKTVYLGTDVATLVLFHPDDLVHRQNDPIAWYGYDFAYSKESAQGRLVAFDTGSDGGYEVRLTTGALSTQEMACACRSWAFPYLVRHGCFLIDNTEALPGREQMNDPARLVNRWYDIASGAYRVVVHPIDRSSEAARELPDYVIVFEAVDSIASIAVASTPPCLRPFRGREPFVPASMETEDLFVWPKGNPDKGTFPLFIVGEKVALLPRQHIVCTISEEIASAVYPDRGHEGKAFGHLVATTSFQADELAALVRVGGLMRGSGISPALGIQCEHIVRVIEGSASEPLQLARIEPINKPDAFAPNDKVRMLQQRLARYAMENTSFEERLESTSFELERLASFRSAEAITTWALMHLDLRFADRLAFYTSPIEERIAKIEQLLL